MMVKGEVRNCGGCGCEILKAKRIENGVSYCATCYPRYFKQNLCETCGETARFYVNTPTKECRRCLRAKRTCARCEKPLPRAGRIIGRRAYCKPCAVYFKKPKACPQCGEMATRLSRVHALGIDHPVCDKCRRITYRTCKSCGKHRPVAYSNDKGNCFCSACEKFVVHLCSAGCGAIVPGDGKSRCKRCYLIHRAKHRAELNRELIEQPWVRQLFQVFVQYYIEGNLLGNVAKKIDHYAMWFYHLDKSLFQREALCQSSMLEIFGIDGLRRHQTVINFLIEKNGLPWDVAVSEAHVERKRAAAILSEVDETLLREQLEAYHLMLASTSMKNGAKRKDRTIRIYLRAAVNLIKSTDCCDITKIKASELHDYCKSHRGDRASILLFVRYINDLSNQALVIEKPYRSGVLRLDKALREDVLRSYQGLQKAAHLSSAQAYLVKLISLVYDVRMGSLLSLRWKFVLSKGASIGLLLDVGEIVLDEEISRQFKAWMHAGAPLDFVFRGRHRGQPLGLGAVRYHIKNN